jgi:hypothetical protein
MRMLSFCYLIPLAAFAAPAMSAVSEPTETHAPSLSLSLADLQARFADLQRQARTEGELFELRLVGAGQDLLGQVNDGIVRLPEDWAAAAPDRETLDFIMLLGLADAIARKPAPKGPNTATKIVTGTLGWIAANTIDNTGHINLFAPRFDSNASPSEPMPTLRALNWTTVAGGCEARVIFGLRQLEAMNGPIGRDARQILKALGPVAWTPNDQCGPQGR